MWMVYQLMSLWVDEFLSLEPTSLDSKLSTAIGCLKIEKLFKKLHISIF